MTDHPLILTIDVGTTAVKVSLFEPGALLPLGTAVEEYRLDTAPGGIVEVDPRRYQQALREGLMQIAPLGADRVAAIGVTSQGETLIPVNEAGEPLAKAIVWLDCRAVSQAEALRRQIAPDDFYRATGLPKITPALPLAKLVWLREKRPELYHAAYRFLLIEDYLLHWLTGRFVTERSLHSSTGWFHLPSDGWWEVGFEAAGADPTRFAELLPCGTAVGTLNRAAAEELRLPASAVVVTGAMDQAAAAVGMGCVTDGKVIETTGTALVLAACTSSLPGEGAPVTIYRHALDGKYLYLPFEKTAGMALKWFKDHFCQEYSGQDIYAELDRLAAEVPPGCDGLVALPYLAGSTGIHNDPNARGLFYGVTLDTRKGHFVRSILECVGYQVREFLEVLRQAGIDPDEVLSLGGGSKSPLWQQIKADICQKSFVAARCAEAPSAGAALLAARGAGLPLPAVLPKPEGKTSLPDFQKSAAYTVGYHTFQALYRAAAPLWQAGADSLPKEEHA